jgi:serine/threonine protein kinase
MDAGAGENRTEPRRGEQVLKLGRYEVVRELGKGAMGIVYLAKDPLIGRLVALKTIRPAAHADDDETREFQQRFIREAQAAGILNHPAIVTVHDIGQDEGSGTSFIAMEYVEGQNIKEVLQQGRALTFEQIADIVSQVADALDFAHSKGIVHRDVKPANIILLDGNRAKITDFGIAKIASSSANLTSTGQFLGTPNYMAPEQIKGAPVDGRTDLFSLGICLYEMLTRRKPFGGDSLTSISYKIVHEPFPPLHEINPQIPDGFEDVVARCLAKEPGKRYQRGKELGSALRAVMRGERPPAEPLFAEETVVTRDIPARGDRVPTVEIPFPEAEEATPLPSTTRPVGQVERQASSPVVEQRQARTPAAPHASVLRRRISPPLFLTIVAVLVLGLLGSIAALSAKKVPAPKEDRTAEARRAKERELRIAGNEALRKGRVDDAYEKFAELQKLAPNSPANNEMLTKLNAIRQQDLISKQQLSLAQQKLEAGIALYNNKEYAASIPLFQEAFHLNPSSDVAVNYLKQAQTEAAKAEAAQRRTSRNATRVATATMPPVTTTAPARPATAQPVAANVAPAHLTTVFSSPAPDGYIQVKVGSQMLAHENLWEEKGRLMFRRRTPRVVKTTNTFTPVNADLDVWIVIPTLSIQEHHVIRQNFPPGSAHTLLVTFEPGSKHFDYQLN